MIDRLLCARADRGGYVVDDSYAPEQAVQGVNLLNEAADKLAVIFPPWHGGGRFLEAFVARLSNGGYAVAKYNFHHQIIEPDVNRVVESFLNIQTTITEDLQELNGKHDYEDIHFFGASLGIVALALVAAKFPGFDRATMIVPGSNLAGSLWEGTRTQAIREDLSKQGATAGMLDQAWHEIAPKTHAAAFKDKDVKVVVSEADKIIPSRYQVELVNELASQRANIRKHRTRLGHYSTIVQHYLLEGV